RSNWSDNLGKMNTDNLRSMNMDNPHSMNRGSTYRMQTARMNCSRNMDILILHSSSSDRHCNSEYRSSPYPHSGSACSNGLPNTPAYQHISGYPHIDECPCTMT